MSFKSNSSNLLWMVRGIIILCLVAFNYAKSMEEKEQTAAKPNINYFKEVFPTKIALEAKVVPIPFTPEQKKLTATLQHNEHTLAPALLYEEDERLEVSNRWYSTNYLCNGVKLYYTGDGKMLVKIGYEHEATPFYENSFGQFVLNVNKGDLLYEKKFRAFQKDLIDKFNTDDMESVVYSYAGYYNPNRGLDKVEQLVCSFSIHMQKSRTTAIGVQTLKEWFNKGMIYLVGGPHTKLIQGSLSKKYDQKQGPYTKKETYNLDDCIINGLIRFRVIHLKSKTSLIYKSYWRRQFKDSKIEIVFRPVYEGLDYAKTSEIESSFDVPAISEFYLPYFKRLSEFAELLRELGAAKESFCDLSEEEEEYDDGERGRKAKRNPVGLMPERDTSPTRDESAYGVQIDNAVASTLEELIIYSSQSFDDVDIKEIEPLMWAKAGVKFAKGLAKGIEELDDLSGGALSMAAAFLEKLSQTAEAAIRRGTRVVPGVPSGEAQDMGELAGFVVSTLSGQKLLSSLIGLSKKVNGSKKLLKRTQAIGKDNPKAPQKSIKLNRELSAEEIARGHSFEKHVVKGGEFKDLGINTVEEFQAHIEKIITNPTEIRYYRKDRKVYLHEPSETVIVVNKRSGEGTAFRPEFDVGWDVYLSRLPTRTVPYY